MYIDIYIHKYICIHSSIYTHMCTYIYKYIPTYIFRQEFVPKNMHASYITYTYIYMDAQMYVQKDKQIFTHIFIWLGIVRKEGNS